jgi:hypothetical protein
MERRFGFKHRDHQANISVSAHGPAANEEFERGGHFLRPRMAADLRYTTADADFLRNHWRDPWDPGRHVESFRSKQPTCRQFWDDVVRACDWLAQHRSDDDWNGGGLNLTFAGHGRDGDGALVLEDGVVSPDELVERLREIWSRLPEEVGRLRVSLRLDSCYSGGFLLRWLSGTYAYSDELAPYFSQASCMPDEISWEESSLGHGVFTYCTSHRSEHPFSLGTEAVQPDNSYGPSLRVAANEFGCSRLTGGQQNPVRFFEYGALELLDQRVSIEDLLPLPTPDKMEDRIRSVRDNLAPKLTPFGPGTWRVGHVEDSWQAGQMTDEEVLDGLQYALEQIRSAARLGKPG